MAQFDFYLNRQGVRGPQGIQGEQGFSPIITVATNTLSEYVLQIQTQNNTFLTANLREHKDDLGGTYIRYNRETGVMFAGDADVASQSQMGVVRFATATDIEREDDSSVVSPADVADMIEAVDPSGDISDLQSRVTTLEGETESLGRSVSDNSLAISALQSSVSGLLANYVPKTRTINGYALSSNITLTANDVNAYSKSEADTLLAAKADVSDLPDMNNYYNTTQIDLMLNEKADISDIPTVGNGTITINQGGVQRGQFSVNQSGDTTINLTDGGGGGGGSYIEGNGIDITNDIISVVPDGTTIDFNTNGELKVISTPTPSNMVTTDTTQTISGTKTFSQSLTIGDRLNMTGSYVVIANNSGNRFVAVDETNHEVEVGESTFNLTLQASDVNIARNNQTYTNIDSGNIGSYALTSLPTASTSTLGGVKIDGTSITIDSNGVISSSGGSGGATYEAGTAISISPKTLYAHVNSNYTEGGNMPQYIYTTELLPDSGAAEVTFTAYNADGTVFPSSGHVEYYGSSQNGMDVILYNANDEFVDASSYTRAAAGDITVPDVYTISANYQQGNYINISGNTISSNPPLYTVDDTMDVETKDFLALPRADGTDIGYATLFFEADVEDTQHNYGISVGDAAYTIENITTTNKPTLSPNSKLIKIGTVERFDTITEYGITTTLVCVSRVGYTGEARYYLSVYPDGSNVVTIQNLISAVVDQTYSATSTNAQSGVAIANAGFLTSIPTASTSTLGGVKVDGTTITIDSNGVISSSGGGGSSYTAGTGIDITNDVISIDDSVVASKDDLDSKQDTLEPQAPLSIVQTVTPNMINLVSNESETGVYRGTEYTLSYLQNAFLYNYSANGLYFDYAQSVPSPIPDTAQAIMDSLGYIQIPYTIGQIVNGGDIRTGNNHSSIVFGKTVDGEFIPIFSTGSINMFNSTTKGQLFTNDAINVIRNSSSSIILGQTKVEKTANSQDSSHYTAVNIGQLGQVYDNGSTAYITIYCGLDRGTYSGAYNVSFTGTERDRILEIDTVRIFLSNSYLGITSSNPISVSKVGLYDYTGQLPINLNLSSIPSEWGNNLFDIFGATKKTSLSLSVGTGLAVQNGSLVNTVDVSNKVTGTGITNMVALTQAQYDALATKNANTFYVIVAASGS